MKIFFYALTFVSVILLFMNSCKKDKPDNTPIQVTHIIKNATIKGANDGSIVLTVTGGVTPYTFNWSNGAITKDISGLKAGTYICFIQDAINQVKVDTSIVYEPGVYPPLVVTDSIGMVSFKGGKDGRINLTVVSGVPPYTFNWSNGATTEDISGLKAGTYTCTIKDSVNQVKIDSIVITEPDKYEIIKVTTDSGEMYYWLYNQTPNHKKNFLKLTEEKYFDSVIFHRVVINFVIQTGDPSGTGNGGKAYVIPAEFHDSLTHVFGAIGAARNNNPQKNSHGSQHYVVVNLSGEHGLDHNYTVFGIVIKGMDVAMKISKVAVNSSSRPLTNIYMKKVEIVRYTEQEILTNFGFKIPTFN